MFKFLISISTIVLVHGEWVYDATHVAPSEGSQDFYGDSLAHDGNTLVVGVPGRDRVYIYVEDNSSIFQLQQEIERRSIYGIDRFGSSVAIEDDTLVVGSPGVFGGGAAYIFHRSDNTWEEATNLTGYVQDNVDEFGTAVDVYTSRYGRLVAVGSPKVEAGDIGDAGAVFEYYYNEATGTYDSTGYTIRANPRQMNGRFGSTVALDYDTLFSTQSQRLHVLLERLGDGDWYDNGNSRVPPAEGEAFGEAIAVRHLIGSRHPDHVFVGAPNANSGTGKVYVYEFVPYEGLYGVLDELTASDGYVGARFGTSLATYDSMVVVGATKFVSPGKVYVFTPDATGTYQERQILENPGGFEGDTSGFGSAIAINESVLAVGAPYSAENGFRAGAVYIFRHTGPSSPEPTLAPSPIPTLAPTEQPSFVHSYIPTVAPTNQPSPGPSSAPSAVETSPPTPLLTSAPSSSPTPDETEILPLFCLVDNPGPLERLRCWLWSLFN